MVNDDLRKQKQKWYICVSRQEKKKSQLSFMCMYNFKNYPF